MNEMAVKVRKPSSILGRQERAILHALLYRPGKRLTISALRSACWAEGGVGAPDSVCRVLRDSRKKALVWPIQSARVAGKPYCDYWIDLADLTPEHWEMLK